MQSVDSLSGRGESYLLRHGSLITVATNLYECLLITFNPGTSRKTQRRRKLDEYGSCREGRAWGIWPMATRQAGMGQFQYGSIWMYIVSTNIYTVTDMSGGVPYTSPNPGAMVRWLSTNSICLRCRGYKHLCNASFDNVHKFLQEWMGYEVEGVFRRGMRALLYMNSPNINLDQLISL